MIPAVGQLARPNVEISMRRLSLLAFAGLCACTGKAETAEKHYELVSRIGTNGDICDAGRAVAAAYLEAGNGAKYDYWRTASAINCATAELEGRDLKPGEAGRLEAMADNIEAAADADSATTASKPVDAAVRRIDGRKSAPKSRSESNEWAPTH